jgi:hypothetical protein
MMDNITNTLLTIVFYAVFIGIPAWTILRGMYEIYKTIKEK